MNTTVELKAALYLYHCHCGNKFKSAVYPITEGSYGEFLLKATANDALAYLYALNDPAFSEVSQLVKSHAKIMSLTEREKSDIFQKIVGIAYDCDEEDGEFKIGLPPLCLSCGKRDIDYFEKVIPSEYVILDIPRATSNTWNRLSKIVKDKLVSNAVIKLLDGKAK